jgi:hypothetical protein
MRVLLIGGRELAVSVCLQWAHRQRLLRILYIDDQPPEKSLQALVNNGILIYRQSALSELGYHNVTKNIDLVLYLGLYNLRSEPDSVRMLMQAFQTTYQCIGIAEHAKVACYVVYPLLSLSIWPYAELAPVIKLLCDCYQHRPNDEQSDERSDERNPNDRCSVALLSLEPMQIADRLIELA